MIIRTKRKQLLTGALLGVLSLATVAHSATLSFTNNLAVSATSRLWSPAINWSPNQVPADGDILIFPGTGRSVTNDLTGLKLDTISFSSGGNWFLYPQTTGANAITLSNTVKYITGGAAGNRVVLQVNLVNPSTIFSNSGPRELSFGQNGTTADNLTGPGGVVIYSTVTNVVNYYQPNSYNGDTVINGYLNLQIADAIPNGSGNGNVTINAGGFLNVNGKNDIINGLSGLGTVTNSGASSLLQVGDNDATSIFDGVIANGANALNLQKIGAGTLTLNGANPFTGTCTAFAGTLKLGNALALQNASLTMQGGSLSFGATTTAIIGGVAGSSGPVTLQNDSSAAVTLTVGKSGTATTTYSGSVDGTGSIIKTNTNTQLFTGANTFSGNVTVAKGTLGLTALSTGGGAVSVSDGATFRADGSSGSTLNLSGLTNGVSTGCTLILNMNGLVASPAVVNATNLTTQGTVTLNVTSANALTVGSTNLLIAYTGTVGGSGSNAFVLGTLPTGVAGHLLQSPGAVSVVVDSIGNLLTWTGSVNALWDTNTFNWVDALAIPTNYVNAYAAPLGDVVTFDDTGAGQPNVTLTTNLQPASVKLTQLSGGNYVFNGPGKLTGGAVLSVNAIGSLRINTTNDFTGGTTLSAGTLQLGSDQALGAGPLTLNVGGVTLSALSSDGLSARTITNAVTISVGGTQVFGDAVNTGTVTIASKINFSSGNRTISTVSPTVWSGGSQNGQINNKKGDSSLTLKGTNDWLLGTATFLLQQGTVVLDGGSLTIPNEIRLDGNVAAGITKLIIANGAVITNTALGGDFYVGYNSPLYASVTNWVDFAGMMRYPNNPGNTANNRLLLARGANSSVGTRSVANLLAGGDVEFSQVIKSGTFLGTPGYGEFNFDGGILRALADNASFVVGFDVCSVRSGGANIDSRSFTVSIPQNLDAGSPSGGLTKTGNGTLFLNGTNTYTGDTLASAGMLGGSGSVVGTVNCSGGTFAPGGNTSIKTFIIGGTLWATNQTVFTLNKTVSPSNSMAVVTGTINVGGTLTVTNIGTGGGAALAAGNSFQLFNKAVTGTFAPLNLPTPPANTAWTNKLAIDGSIALYATQPAPASIAYSVIGGDLVLTWPNGAGWTLEAQTNSLSTGLGTNWVLVPGATSPFTNAVDSVNGSVFYRLKY